MDKKKKPAPVEKWKLTPELLEIEKSYKARHKLSEMLKQGITTKATELNVMTTALHKIEKQKEALAGMVPSDRLEVDGTPFPDDVDLSINY